MGYPSTVDTGLIVPAMINNEATAQTSNITTVISSTLVRLYSFETQVPIVITAARWYMGATATGKTNMGIYTQSGSASALIAGSDSGQVTNVANSDNTFTYTTPISLSPGQYFMAIACTNTTDTYMGRGAGAASALYRWRVGANSPAAGALPATTGALSIASTLIAMSLITQGGLP